MSMLETWLTPHAAKIYALLRIASGLLFSFHGAQKVFGVFSTKEVALFSQLGLGGLIELVCGLLIAVGFWTRGAAFLSSGTMAVAYTQFHWKLQGGAEFFPAVNKGELALLYALVFLLIAAQGSGVWALARAREKGRGLGEAQKIHKNG